MIQIVAFAFYMGRESKSPEAVSSGASGDPSVLENLSELLPTSGKIIRCTRELRELVGGTQPIIREEMVSDGQSVLLIQASMSKDDLDKAYHLYTDGALYAWVTIPSKSGGHLPTGENADKIVPGGKISKSCSEERKKRGYDTFDLSKISPEILQTNPGSYTFHYLKNAADNGASTDAMQKAFQKSSSVDAKCETIRAYNFAPPSNVPFLDRPSCDSPQL